MKNYIIMRLLATVPLLLGISFLCFVFINLIPSDPAEVALRIRQTPIITEELIAQTRAELGLDQPFLVRYAHWLWDCLHFDLGVSYTNPARTVLGEIGRCLPATLELAGLSLVYVIVLSLPIGFLSAVYKDTWFDRIMRGVVFATTAMPVYWVGLLLIWIVSIKMDLLPTSGYGGFSSLILPAFTVKHTEPFRFFCQNRCGVVCRDRNRVIRSQNPRGNLPDRLEKIMKLPGGKAPAAPAAASRSAGWRRARWSKGSRRFPACSAHRWGSGRR